jgi:hypothetical protein
MLTVLLLTFLSVMIAQGVLFYEGFEGDTFPPPGWYIEGWDDDWHQIVDGDDPGFVANTGVAAASSRSRCDGGSCLFPDNILFTPQITIPDTLENVFLRFYVAALDTTVGACEEYFDVLVYSGSMLPADSEIVWSETLTPETAGWSSRDIPLDLYVGMSIYIAFHHHDSFDRSALLIDDVSVMYEIVSGEGSGSGVVTQTHGDILVANYPNPFNPTTTIVFQNATHGLVVIDIFNLKGQKVRSLLHEALQSGTHYVHWDGTDDNHRAVASGIYLYQMTTAEYSSTRKMILMK